MESSSLREQEGLAAEEASSLHFVFLHHGYHGRARDFYYLSGIAEDALQPGHAVNTEASPSASPHFVFLHPSGSDLLRTEEGVVACARRYIKHACAIIEETLSAPSDDTSGENSAPRTAAGPLELHFSAVGHSMGGLILRYAFPYLMHEIEQLVARTPRVRSVSWDTFVTMAAPHLGVLYMRSPVMTFLGGQLGHRVSTAIADLFSKNSLVTEELVSDESLAAWARFKRRVVLTVVNDGTVLVYSSSFVMPISVRQRIGTALPSPSMQRQAPSERSKTEGPATVLKGESEPSESTVAEAARGPSHDKEHPEAPHARTHLDVPNTDASVVHLAQHGIFCASTVEGLRGNAYELRELTEELWPSDALPEQRALATRILSQVSSLELHLVDFRPLCDAPIESVPEHVAVARGQMCFFDRWMTHLGAHRFSHAAMACKRPFYYPAIFGFASEYVVSDLLGIPLNVNGLSTTSADARFSAV